MGLLLLRAYLNDGKRVTSEGIPFSLIFPPLLPEGVTTWRIELLPSKGNY